MNENQSNRIWRPIVETTDQILPNPGSANPQLEQQVYTKTSLIKTGESNSSVANLHNLNREILSASQAFNNSPKPFQRSGGAQSTCASPSMNSASVNISTTISNSSYNQRQQELDSARQAAARRPILSQTSSNSQSICNIAPQATEEDMALKLVHKQYNSPIDLYSMNNIRKTIEAHTELIAPGVKGINFMKPDAPVNKQSEVYKLVMEEENQRSRVRSGASATPPRLSPISGQPLNLPPACLGRQEVTASEVKHTIQQQANQSALTEIANSSPANQTMHSPQNSTLQEQLDQQQTGQTGKPPTCCECGQFIVGPFAKIQDRCVHAHCFNCSTCGTSLKNTGYFTVNEKLYCDIHAKQVANLMHIKYNFGEKLLLQREQQQQQQQQQQQHRKLQQAAFSLANQTGQSELQQSNVRYNQESHLQPLTSNTMSSCKQAYSSSTSPATISTMFADRSQSQTTGSGGGDTSWLWRPTNGSELQQSVTASSSTSADNFSAKASGSANNYYTQEETVYSSRHQQQQHSPTPTNNGLTLQELRQQQQQVISMGTRGRGLLQESSSLSGGRLPVCTYCQVQIHGPYILAGRTTWCKHCSQSNFNCSSCRRSLLDTGFIEDNSHKYYCENCFEAYYAPVCSKCNIRIKGDCLNALSKQWHPSCFVCGHCRRPFGNSSFYLEDNVPYCERDWSVLFTTKCYNCSYPILAGDKWIEALERNYHANCFRCSSCQANLEGSTFYSKNGKPYCRLHSR